jgi:hypothetical protein
MIRQRAALLRLLREEDRETLRAGEESTGEGRPFIAADLRALLAEADTVAGARLREIIGIIERENAEEAFGGLCAGFPENGDVEKAAWLLAAALLPAVDLLPGKRLLDAWGAETARRLGKADSEETRAETLVEYLADELGFKGNAEDYYNINNSLLPEVIETRIGIPITLSLVYMLVGRRAGMAVHGIGLPGHFIIGYGRLFFDPFHGGRRLGLDDCRSLVKQHDLVLCAAPSAAGLAEANARADAGESPRPRRAP